MTKPSRTPHPSMQSAADPEAIHLVDLGGLHARMRPALDRAFDEVMATSAFIRSKHVAEFEAQLNETLRSKGTSWGAQRDRRPFALRASDWGPVTRSSCPISPSSPRPKSWPRSAPRPCLQTSTQGPSSSTPFCGTSAHAEHQGGDGGAFVWPVRRHGCLGSLGPRTRPECREDNAQSLGAEWRGECIHGPAGMLGAVGTTSFFPSKTSEPWAMAARC